MTKLLVGCPVLHRAWIMPEWFRHLEVAVEEARIDPADVRCLFVGDPKTDPMTFDEIEKGCRYDWHYISVDERSRPYDRRDWQPKRFVRMVELRNNLLRGVRMIAPDHFLSLDSDILLHPRGIDVLMTTIKPGNFWAVGGKAYMTRDIKAPSFGMLSRTGQLQRSDSDGTFTCDVIMAIKLMAPVAYDVDYEFDKLGEDIGWSKAVRASGGKLVWCGEVANKHVTEAKYLDAFDKRLGW